MSIDDLCRYELPPMADDSVLFLWRLSSMPDEALRLARAWGFRPHSEMIWRKMTKHGKEHFGMGRIVRGAHEPCLICVRGRPKIRSRRIRSVFSAPVGRHSEKPGLFYSLVEELSAGPYCDLFARKHRTGWTSIGNELPSNDVEAAE
jgi:site-specific DNA-methyltransferase (adenine-specific)